MKRQKEKMAPFQTQKEMKNTRQYLFKDTYFFYLLLLCLIYFSLETKAAEASGSGRVRILAPNYSLLIIQTYRKRLYPGREEAYFSAVTRGFLQRASGVIPSLQKWAKRHVRTRRIIGKVRLFSRVIDCKRWHSCPAFKSSLYPALIEFPPIVTKHSERYAFRVSLPFQKRPTIEVLKTLQKQLQGLFERVGGNSNEKGSWVAATPLRYQTSSFRLNLFSFGVYFHPKHATYFSRQQKAVFRNIQKKCALVFRRRNKTAWTLDTSKSKKRKSASYTSLYHVMGYSRATVEFFTLSIQDQKAFLKFQEDLQQCLRP